MAEDYFCVDCGADSTTSPVTEFCPACGGVCFTLKASAQRQPHPALIGQPDDNLGHKLRAEPTGKAPKRDERLLAKKGLI
jgi:hypothetical protein